MNRKAFSPSNVMVYLLALFFGAMILFYGFNAVASISQRGEKAIFLKFQNKLETQIKEISALPGTVRILDFTLPTKFTKICFFEFGKSCSLPSDLVENEPIVCDSVDDESANIFLFPLQENDIKISNIQIEISPLCVDIPAGFFQLQVTGKGKTALLSQP